MPDTSNFMFDQNDNYRRSSLEHMIPAMFTPETFRLTLLDSTHDMFPVAMSKAFIHLSKTHSGRYSDRTMMTVRRWADRVENTNYADRIRDENNVYLPVVICAESPYSYDNDTEIKRGGIHGMLIALPNDEGTYRGILSVSEHSRRQGIGTALMTAAQNFGPRLSMYANRTNLVAMRLAASTGYSPVQVNSVSGVIEYAQI
jgi:GNAT superfamily N-acetyltransferase